MTDLTQLCTHELASGIRAGDMTPSQVMAAHLDRIAQREPEIGAFQCLDPDKAMERAKAADILPFGGPLHGVPFVIKDIIDTKDMPTGWGSALYENRVPEHSATCVNQLIAAGAIPIGKTVTTEFAYFRPGRTANPCNTAHTPGGSSSGSAAAVADFMAPFGLGSQTAASLIRPAAYCGVAAFKPTIGAYDLQGVMELSGSLDTLGLLARDPRDLVLLDAVLRDAEPPTEADFDEAKPRISLMRGPHWQDGSVEMRDICTRALAAIAKAGGETGEITHPDVFKDLTQAHVTVMGYETARTRAAEAAIGPPVISQQFCDLVIAGRTVSDTDYRAALDLRNRANTILDHLFRDTDALLVPSAPGPAPHGLDATGDPLFSRMWNLLQLPCVALPFGQTQENLPLGFQLIGPRGQDSRLLDIACWVFKQLADSG